VASKFRNFGLPMGDLIQEGHVGLLEAAARFEPEREVRFSTYATWWIRASIQDYILRNWSIVRGGTSSSQKALFFNLRRLRAKSVQRPDTMTDFELHQKIADAIGVKQADVALMNARLSGPDTSLNAPVSTSDGERGPPGFPGLRRNRCPTRSSPEIIDRTPQPTGCFPPLEVLSERELKRIVRERRLTEDGATLESLGVEARHFQGTGAPDRKPRYGKTEIGPP
jgi:RNA polymerase sigma-32 factor